MEKVSFKFNRDMAVKLDGVVTKVEKGKSADIPLDVANAYVKLKFGAIQKNAQGNKKSASK